MAWDERPRSGQPPKVTPALEAHLTSLACSEAPAGAARWALSLPTERVVELRYVASISGETIRQVLKKLTQTLVGRAVVHRHYHGGVRGQSGKCARLVRAARQSGRGTPVLR